MGVSKGEQSALPCAGDQPGSSSHCLQRELLNNTYFLTLFDTRVNSHSNIITIVFIKFETTTLTRL